MEKGKIEFDDPTFRPNHPVTCVCVSCEAYVASMPPSVKRGWKGIVRRSKQKQAEDRDENQAQIAQFQTLIELLEAGDVESVKSWLIGAVKTLERI